MRCRLFSYPFDVFRSKCHGLWFGVDICRGDSDNPFCLMEDDGTPVEWVSHLVVLGSAGEDTFYFLHHEISDASPFSPAWAQWIDDVKALEWAGITGSRKIKVQEIGINLENDEMTEMSLPFWFSREPEPSGYLPLTRENNNPLIQSGPRNGFRYRIPVQTRLIIKEEPYPRLAMLDGIREDGRPKFAMRNNSLPPVEGYDDVIDVPLPLDVMTNRAIQCARAAWFIARLEGTQRKAA